MIIPTMLNISSSISCVVRYLLMCRRASDYISSGRIIEAKVIEVFFYLRSAPSGSCFNVRKLDIRNTLNTFERKILNSIRVYQNIASFSSPSLQALSSLFFYSNVIISQVGGALVFSLAIHKVIPCGTLMMTISEVSWREDALQDLALHPYLIDLSQQVNSSKCEFFPSSVCVHIHLNSVFIYLFIFLFRGLKTVFIRFSAVKFSRFTQRSF